MPALRGRVWAERSRAIHENQAAKSAAGIWIDVVAGGLVSDPDVAKQLGFRSGTLLWTESGWVPFICRR